MNSVIFGLQWGDEGKGKVATYLSRDYDFVVRFAGGSNAGHTVEYPEFKVVHHLVPSFDIASSTKGYIANGVVVDLAVLNAEIDELEKRTDLRDRLFVSSHSHVVLPVHRELDALVESVKGERAVGTTKRGIGPAYADRVHRTGVRIVDFATEEALAERLSLVRKVYRELYRLELVDEHKLFEYYERVSRFVIDPMEMRERLVGASVLFESTQGVLLDVDMGTYPYVTSVNCGPSGVEAGVGFRIDVGKRIGVFKAYLTRVGEGPFPTELRGEEGEDLRRAGGEYGATTGRPRRCGWLDLPLLRYAVEVSGCDEMVMTKADVLSGRERVKVGVRYVLGGKKLELPKNLEILDKVSVEYVEFEGWKSFDDPSFEKFLRFIESETGKKIVMLSTGAGVDDIVRL